MVSSFLKVIFELIPVCFFYAIKSQIDANVDRCKDEKYTTEEYETFLKIMNEHRGRGFGSVSHSKMYEQIDKENPLATYRISKK